MSPQKTEARLNKNYIYIIPFAEPLNHTITLITAADFISNIKNILMMGLT